MRPLCTKQHKSNHVQDLDTLIIYDFAGSYHFGSYTTLIEKKYRSLKHVYVYFLLHPDTLLQAQDLSSSFWEAGCGSNAASHDSWGGKATRL